ncbi:MAG: energy transducer TonB [Hyphomicrobiaceae bacterium]
MRIGLVISIALHATLIGWALFSITATRPLGKPTEVPLAVEMLTVAEFENMRRGDTRAKTVESAAKAPEKKLPKDKAQTTSVAALPPKKEEPKKEEPKKEEPKKEEKKAEPKKEEPKKEPDPIAEVLKKEEPKKEEKKKEEPKKEEKKEAKKEEPKKKDEPKKKAPEKKAAKKEKKKDVVDEIEKALLNLDPNATDAPEGKKKTADASPSKKSATTIGTSSGEGSALTTTEANMLIGMITGKIRAMGCWNINAGGVGAGDIVVRLKFSLSRTGDIEGEPYVLNPENSAEFQRAAMAAVIAIKQCAPYDMLPPDKYENGWRQVTLNFDPTRFAAGGF